MSKKWGIHFQTMDEVICLILFASFVCILVDTKGFAPSDATKGLPDRPLETFDLTLEEILASWGAGSFIFLASIEKGMSFSTV